MKLFDTFIYKRVKNPCILFFMVDENAIVMYDNDIGRHQLKWVATCPRPHCDLTKIINRTFVIGEQPIHAVRSYFTAFNNKEYTG